MIYLRLLEKFLTTILFSKNEYNINSKDFNPLRFLVTCFLVFNVGFSVYLMSHMVKVYDKVNAMCPIVIAEIEKDD